MLKIIAPFIAVIALIVVPLVLIARRAKSGRSVKKPLYANLAGFFTVMAVFAVVLVSNGVAAADEAVQSVSAVQGTDWAKVASYFAACAAVVISGIASARAVSTTACAAIGAMTENEGSFGKSLVFVGMAEGIAIYGLLIGIVMLLF